jgi:alpha-D-ribose 1-methylphosphonate 5-triphosphate synthase subunit PhnG
MIDDDDLRDCFAMFAMMGLISRGDPWKVEDAWEAADDMLEARNKKEPEVGIVAVKSRRRK